MAHTDASEENWLALSRKRNKDAFSELDVLMRSIDRFFNIENLPFSKDDLTTKNFHEELSIAGDAIARVVGLLEIIIPDNKRNLYWFQKFAQSRILDEKKKDNLRRELHKQDTPEKSILLLYDSFLNMKGIVADILKSQDIHYLTYMNIGHLVGKELRENIHFNPFNKEINPEFDVIENREISRVVKDIKERDTKKQISIMLLHLFKFMRYLRYADISNKFSSLKSSIIIILLLRSEINIFKNYLDSMSPNVSDEKLRALCNAVSFQLSIETKRVYLFELKDIFSDKSSPSLKGKLENSHGILKNLTEQIIIQIIQFFNPQIQGNAIFESFITKLEQSLKLREDLLVLNRLLNLTQDAAKKERGQIFEALRNYMLYFQSFTFRLLWFNDYEEFASFFSKTLAFNKSALSGKDFENLLELIRQFNIYVETTLGLISNRSELNGRPQDIKRVENRLNQYLK